MAGERVVQGTTAVSCLAGTAARKDGKAGERNAAGRCTTRWRIADAGKNGMKKMAAAA